MDAPRYDISKLGVNSNPQAPIIQNWVIALNSTGSCFKSNTLIYPVTDRLGNLYLTRCVKNKPQVKASKHPQDKLTTSLNHKDDMESEKGKKWVDMHIIYVSWTSNVICIDRMVIQC